MVCSTVASVISRADRGQPIAGPVARERGRRRPVGPPRCPAGGCPVTRVSRWPSDRRTLPHWSTSCTGSRRCWSSPPSRLVTPSTVRPRHRPRRCWASGWPIRSRAPPDQRRRLDDPRLLWRTHACVVEDDERTCVKKERSFTPSRRPRSNLTRP